MKKSFYIIAATLLSSAPAFAQEAAAIAGSTDKSFYALAAALAIGLAAFGGALAQAKIGGAAMDGIARNPQARGEMFVPMILGLVLIESLVIYGLVIALQLVGKI
jgi:F-type H+-transporting ATPase subunit c